MERLSREEASQQSLEGRQFTVSASGRHSYQQLRKTEQDLEEVGLWAKGRVYGPIWY